MRADLINRQSDNQGAGGKTVFNLKIDKMYIDILMQRQDLPKWNELGLFTFENVTFSTVTFTDKTHYNLSIESMQLDNFLKYNP